MTTTPGVTRALTYGRVSTTEQEASGLSLDHQADALRAECDRRSWSLVAELVDVASAKALTGRPQLAEALRMLKAHEADVLIVSRLDRLSRSVADFCALLDRSRREGWALVVLDLGLDLTSASGEMVAVVLSAMSQFERKLIGARTREALAAKKARGARLGRPVVRCPEITARICTMRAGGMTLTAIAEALNGAQIAPAGAGRRWWPASISKALKSAQLDADASTALRTNALATDRLLAGALSAS